MLQPYSKAMHKSNYQILSFLKIVISQTVYRDIICLYVSALGTIKQIKIVHKEMVLNQN